MTPTPISLTRFLIEEQRAGRISPDLRLLVEVVARACKSISIAVGKGALGGVLGDALSAGEASINVQGEAQAVPAAGRARLRCCARRGQA